LGLVTELGRKVEGRKATGTTTVSRHGKSLSRKVNSRSFATVSSRHAQRGEKSVKPTERAGGLVSVQRT